MLECTHPFPTHGSFENSFPAFRVTSSLSSGLYLFTFALCAPVHRWSYLLQVFLGGVAGTVPGHLSKASVMTNRATIFGWHRTLPSICKKSNIRYGSYQTLEPFLYPTFHLSVITVGSTFHIYPESEHPFWSLDPPHLVPELLQRLPDHPPSVCPSLLVSVNQSVLPWRAALQWCLLSP